jgi:hypothetical protein
MRFGCSGCLLAGSNWNNASGAGPSYLNSNNTVSIINSNISTQLELISAMSGLEHQPDPNQSYTLVKQNENQSVVLVPTGTFYSFGRAES